MNTTSNTRPSQSPRDRGFTLVEIVVVIVILSILALVVAFSIRRVADGSDTTSCGANASTLKTAAEVYMTQEQVDVLPATGTSANKYELFLIDTGLIKQVSVGFDLQADGTVTSNGNACT